MNINEAIKIAVQKSGRPLNDVVVVRYMTKGAIESIIAQCAKDQPQYPHPFALFSRIDSHWNISFKDTTRTEHNNCVNCYIVHPDGDCHEWEMKMPDMEELNGTEVGSENQQER
jgi:hypothetical protein